MPLQSTGRFYPPANEVGNVITHGTGLALCVPAIFLLLRHTRTPADFASSLIYGITLAAVYAASTCLHIGSAHRLRLRLEVLDHSTIYLLIAGTFTPFLVRLGGTQGVALLVLAWLLAAGGIAFKLICGLRHPRISILSYLVLGWFPLVSLHAIFCATSWSAIEWLMIGGAAYTAGVPVYLASRKRFALHPLWHFFVMLGSACHYIAIWFATTR